MIVPAAPNSSLRPEIPAEIVAVAVLLPRIPLVQAPGPGLLHQFISLRFRLPQGRFMGRVLEQVSRQVSWSLCVRSHLRHPQTGPRQPQGRPMLQSKIVTPEPLFDLVPGLGPAQLIFHRRVPGGLVPDQAHMSPRGGLRDLAQDLAHLMSPRRGPRGPVQGRALHQS